MEQGLREFPNECCGVIAAADGVPVKVFTMKNADASPVTYRLDGKEQLRSSTRWTTQGWDLWAIYHSHTHSEAYPSETDRVWPSIRTRATSCCRWRTGRSPVIRSFCIRDGDVVEEELTIT